MRFLSLVIFSMILITSSCVKEKKHTTRLPLTTYTGTIEAQDDKEIAFTFKAKTGTSLEIYNADEIIEVDEISYINDSIVIKLPVFESIIKAQIATDSSLSGYYIKPNLNRTVPFYAKPGTERFDITADADFNVTGNWKVEFSPDSDNPTVAKGIFKQHGNKLTGTFRTTTGDYRYLEGVVEGDLLKLSTFDGAHAYLFTASVTDSSMTGNFYSGNHYKEPFAAQRDETFELADPDTLTSLKKGYDKLTFSFPDENGNMVSLDDDRFKNKVVVVQIMGTWCPNCLDETRYFSNYYKANKNKPVEFVALAFEYVKSDTLAFKAINRLKERTGIEYPVLLAQYGTTNKKKAQEKLPMLNHIISYPTSIFIDKKGKVRKIHTGFNGPATAEKYETFKKEFNNFMDKLIAEK